MCVSYSASLGRYLHLFFTLASLAIFSATARGDGGVAYNRDVRPILSENCFPCHGPDSAARKADLRLDRRDDALQAGVFTPGKPDASELIERIFAEDAGKRMPPAKSRKTLTAAQKDTLKRWIA